jgi:hypothetical protein
MLIRRPRRRDVRDVGHALARWRDAERRFRQSEPGSLAHAVAEIESNDAQAEYDRLVDLRRAKAAEAELLSDEAPAT